MADYYLEHTSEVKLSLGRAWTAHVKEIRTAKGWTQGQLAEWLGVSRAHVRACEQGRRTYSLAIRRRVADELGGDRELLRADEAICPHCGHPQE